MHLPPRGTLTVARELVIDLLETVRSAMNEMSQLASAMLTIFFAAIMLVAGEM
jgi:hypothetical protein